MAIGCSTGDCSPISAEEARNFLIQEQGRLLGLVQQSIDELNDPYYKLLAPTRVPYDFAMGEGQTSPILRNTVPSDLDADNQWDVVRPQGIFNQDGTSPCCTDPVVIKWGYDYRKSCLKQWSFKTPKFCVVDLQYKFQLAEQLSHIKTILSNVSSWFWRNYLRLAYRQNIMHFTMSSTYINAGSLPGQEGNYITSIFPDRFISPLDLPYFYNKMKYNGGPSGAMMRYNGAPIFGLIASDETIFSLLHADPKFREIINWSYQGAQQGNPLLKAMGDLGLNERYYNFMPIVDMFPRRFDNVGGVLTQIKSHIESPAADGVRSDVNPDWEAADFEEIVFFNSKVMEWQVPSVSGVSALGLPSQSYTGDVQAIVPPRGDSCDPLQKNAYWLAEFMAGIRPMFPEYGMTLLIKRNVIGVKGICPDVCRVLAQPSGMIINEDGILIIDAGYTSVEGQLLIFTQTALETCTPATIELVGNNGDIVVVTIIASDTALDPKRYVVDAVDPTVILNPLSCGGFRAIRCTRTLPTPVANPDCDCE
jgi:hypothetical protein